MGRRSRESAILETLGDGIHRDEEAKPAPGELIVKLSALLDHLETLAPLATAEDWDNVGLLWGDCTADIAKVMTCLTLTPDVADEAIQAGVQLVVTHHPVLFKAVRRVTADTTEGRMLWRLARGGVAVYSPHTAWDNAPAGINAFLSQSLGLTDIQPLRPFSAAMATDATLGSGRSGPLPSPMTLQALAELVAETLNTRSIELILSLIHI